MANVQAVSAGGFDEEHERDFRDFIGSIAVSEEELVAIVNLPDYSIPQVKQYLRKARLIGESLARLAGPWAGNTPALAGAAASSSSQRLLAADSPARTLTRRKALGKLFQVRGRVAGQAVPLALTKRS
jgi:hypothetical protein